MNQHAFIDGYVGKDAAGPAGPEGPAAPSNPFDQAVAAGKKQYDSYLQWIRRPEASETFDGGENAKFLKNPLIRWATDRDPEGAMLSTPYKPRKMSMAERYAPKFVVDSYKAGLREKVMADMAKGNYTLARQFYGSSPEARREMQAKAVPKIKSKIKQKVKSALPWVAGGAGLIFLMTTLFRKKQQGAPPQQIADLQNRIRQMQQQQRPMRLNMVGNR